MADLHAERVGHGYHLFKAMAGRAQEHTDKIVQYLAEHRVTLEVCLSSNEQTMPDLRNNLTAHAFRRMLDYRLRYVPLAGSQCRCWFPVAT